MCIRDRFDASLHQVETLICKGESLKRLNFLSGEDNRLKRFSIDCGYNSSRSYPLRNLDCLRFAKNLERLDIGRSGLESLDFATKLENLEQVQLEFNKSIESIEGLSGSANSLKSIVLALNYQLYEYEVLEQPMPRLKKLVLSDFGSPSPYARLQNVQLDLKGDLSRFDQLEIPNRTRIGEPNKMQALWKFYQEHEKW